MTSVELTREDERVLAELVRIHGTKREAIRTGLRLAAAAAAQRSVEGHAVEREAAV